MVGRFLKKIKAQLHKLEASRDRRELKNFKRSLKACGTNSFIQFPVRFEGPEAIAIGDHVSINAFVHIWGQGGVDIGNDCLIASHVAIISVTHDSRAALYRSTTIANKVCIGNNVWIGAHATVLPGVTLGDNVIVGAGSVVNKSFPNDVVIAGVPAVIIHDKRI